jgi:predicted ATPase/class 3 adenylate cyclase
VGAAALPTGLVTLVFTDIEGSTRLLHELGDGYGRVLADHHRLLRAVWAAHDGVEVDTEGDAFFVAFASARAAVSAAAAAQRVLAAHAWPHDRPVRVRIGVHSGEPQQHDQTYWGIDVHYAARLCGAAHGGQVLLSAATRALVADAEVDDLGEHSLKDFPVPRSLFHLVTDGQRAGDFPAPRTLDAGRTNLPSLATPLVGREAELAELARRLTESPERLVTMTGAGGSGKTKLAIACGTELLECFADGVFLVPLAPVADVAGVAPALLDALDPPRKPGGAEASLVDYLRGRELLLVIDNFEHVLAEAPLVGRLLDAAPRLRVLATSQAPLRLSAESVMPLEPLAPAEAVALFVERARAADPTFALTPANHAVVSDLCRALDGLPLALELAAARVRMAGVEGVLAALGRGIDALGRGSRDLPARQRGLRAALDFTVSLLDDESRELFAALGAFADSWTVEHAERLLGEELDLWEAMANLLDLSLIRTRGDGRLTMAQRVKGHARELLAAGGRELELRGRHAELMAELAEALDAGQIIDHSATLAQTREIQDEIEYALTWSRAHEPALHRRLIGGVGRIFWFTGRLPPLTADIQRLANEERGQDVVSGNVMIARAMVEFLVGDLQTPAVWMGRALDCHRRTASRARLLSTMGLHNHALTLAGDGRAARVAIAEALVVADGFPDPRFRQLFEGTLAFAAVADESWEEAEVRLQELVRHPERTDFAARAAPAYLADCALGRGDGELALRRYLDSLEEYLGLEDINNALIQLFGVAASLVLLNRDGEAARILGASRERVREIGSWEGLFGIAAVSRALQTLPQRMERDEYERELATGAALSFDELVDLARSLVSAHRMSA